MSKLTLLLLSFTVIQSVLIKTVDSNGAAIHSSSPSSSSSSSPPSLSSSAGAKDSEDDMTSSSFTTSTSSKTTQLPVPLSDLGTVIPGVYKEYLPQPIFYESVVPAIFQFQTPKWNKTDITFNNWYTCVTETVPYRYSCPVTFHMNKAIVNLHTDFESLHPISDSGSQDPMKTYYERLTQHSEFCDRIQKHFAGVWTDSSDLQRYLSALQGCSRGSELHPYFDRSILDYNYSIRQPFTKMENNFYNTFYKHILGSGGSKNTTSLDLVASALLSNTRTSLQGAILGQYYAEKNRWVHANQDCRQGYMPTSLLTPEKFNESLGAISKMGIFHHENELSIPPSQMSKYYSLPLSDCTHTADSFVVRVLIPISKKFRGEIIQLVHVHTIPFQYKDHICRVKNINKNYNYNQATNMLSSSMYLYHELTHRAYPTECKPNELCKISEYMLDPRRSDPCVSSLLSKNDSGIRAHCDFECLPKEEYVLPSVVRVSSSQFVVTGNSVSVRIVCGRLTQTEKLVYTREDHVGAMLVKLPCHCRMILPHFSVFYGSESCEKEKDITDVEDGGTEDRGDLNYDNGVSVSSIIPFMFGKKIMKVIKQQQEKTANSVNHDDESGDYFDSLGQLAAGQLINLTEIIDAERIEGYIRSSEVRRRREESKQKGMDFYAEKLQSGGGGDDYDHGEGGGLGGFFWTIFIISLIVILSLQVYIIVMFKRFERVSYSKDDRILYRVEPDDTTSLG